MTSSGNNQTGHTLPANPEVLRAIALKLLLEAGPPPIQASAPTNRFRFNIRFFGEGEAEGTLGIAALLAVLMILALLLLSLGQIH
jgi:hypothetical protein